MPLLNLLTSAPLDDEISGPLAARLSKLVASAIGKPERYVMVALGSRTMAMSGGMEPSAFADLRSIGGLTADVKRKLSAEICALLEKSLRIPPGRVYLNFTDVPPEDWGWNGSTFA